MMGTKNTTDKVGLVFTMHKTGSSTLMQAMREIGMNPERGYAENVGYLKPLSSYHGVVTGVRDPIARNISYFFEIHGNEMLSWKYDLEKVLDAFFEREDRNQPPTWFDDVFKPLFGVNAYKGRFAKTRGWSIREKRYLIVQTERMEEVLPDAFESLYGKRPPSIHRAKTVETRPYGELYCTFLDWVRFPEEYVEKMYDSKFVKHFFLKKQVDAWRKRWVNGL